MGSDLVQKFSAFAAAFALLIGLGVSQPAIAQAFDVDALAPAIAQVRTPTGTGSGSLIVEGDRVTLLTNRHVVIGYEEVDVAVLLDVNEPAVPTFKARLMSFSPDYDMALYHVYEDMDGRPVTAADLLSGDHPSGFVLPRINLAAEQETLGRGESIAILGYPGLADDELVYTAGIISSVQMQEVNSTNGKRVVGWYRTNAEMSPGNSGGVAVNQDGDIIGIPTAVYTEQTTGGRLGSILATPLVRTTLANDDELLTAWADFENGNGLLASASATYGSHELDQDAIAEDFETYLYAGGNRDVSYLGGECVGEAAAEPDFQFDVKEPLTDMLLAFAAESDGDDAVLILNDPSGNWYCNDDAYDDSMNPAMVMDFAEAGTYRVWVGSYQSGAVFGGTLLARQGGGLIDAATALRPNGGQSNSGMALNWQNEPYYGSASLDEGFVPDPFSVTVRAGGQVDVSAGGYGGSCTGYASESPDFRLNWSGSTEDLRVYFEPDDEYEDATLIINTSNGQWWCNDDASDETLNPAVDLSGMDDGRFDIWVGRYTQGELMPGTLYISELPGDSAGGDLFSGLFDDEDSDGLDWSASANYGEVELSENFLPDPHEVNVIAGGSVDVSSQDYGGECTGYASRAPDLTLRWDGETTNLNLYFVADDDSEDATLIVNTSSGDWVCNDDAHMSTLNPQVYLGDSSAGRFDIWVGTYSEGENVFGTLHVSELNRVIP
jgi:serine protease Do